MSLTHSVSQHRKRMMNLKSILMTEKNDAYDDAQTVLTIIKSSLAVGRFLKSGVRHLSANFASTLRLSEAFKSSMSFM